ncbi:YfjD family protein [Neobacillus sp. LXY-4]|uniref:YfjD family protein n=1 Tax=Neobacillus sp. LXY-4 TaxID=3379826 RepID=UPI003EE16C45
MDQNIIEVRSRLFHRIWLFLGSVGMAIASVWLFFEGIKFEYRMSLNAIVASFIGLPFGLMTFLWSWRAYTKKGLLFSIKPGENGQIIYRKGAVNFRDIKEIDEIQEFKLYKPRTMVFSDLTIKTTQNKTIKIPTYNILAAHAFKDNVEKYIYPYMTSEAQQKWKKRYEKKATVA